MIYSTDNDLSEVCYSLPRQVLFLAAGYACAYRISSSGLAFMVGLLLSMVTFVLGASIAFLLSRSVLPPSCTRKFFKHFAILEGESEERSMRSSVICLYRTCPTRDGRWTLDRKHLHIISLRNCKDRLSIHSKTRTVLSFSDRVIYDSPVELRRRFSEDVGVEALGAGGLAGVETGRVLNVNKARLRRFLFLSRFLSKRLRFRGDTRFEGGSDKRAFDEGHGAKIAGVKILKWSCCGSPIGSTAALIYVDPCLRLEDHRPTPRIRLLLVNITNGLQRVHLRAWVFRCSNHALLPRFAGLDHALRHRGRRINIL